MKWFSHILQSILLACTIIFTACGEGSPSGVLPQEKMQAVLWDVAMAGEFANGYIYYQKPGVDRVAVNNKLLDEICKVHGITKAEFEKSLAYYKSKPKLLVAMLDSITAKQTGIRPSSEDPALNDPSLPGTPPAFGPRGGEKQLPVLDTGVTTDTAPAQ